jgi:hypothetical protein
VAFWCICIPHKHYQALNKWYSFIFITIRYWCTHTHMRYWLLFLAQIVFYYLTKKLFVPVDCARTPGVWLKPIYSKTTIKVRKLCSRLHALFVMFSSPSAPGSALNKCCQNSCNKSWCRIPCDVISDDQRGLLNWCQSDFKQFDITYSIMS